VPETVPTILRIVTLDLSLNSTGVASSDGPLNDLETWALKPPGDIDDEYEKLWRLQWIRNTIRLILAGPHETADLVVIEGYAPGRKYQREAMGELGGVIKLDLFEQGYPFAIVGTNQLKLYATGKGNSAKFKVGQAAAHRSGRAFDTDDEADAWWLHQMASAHYGLPHVPMPALNRAVLDKIAWPEIPMEVVA
jgi:Holliday junction resolvasome RuvABC endonuclease subunit